MAKVRVWYQPNGRVKVTQFFVPESEWDRYTQIMREDGTVDAGATYDDMDHEELPPALDHQGRSTVEKWRRHPSGRGVHVDHSIPDPPHPRQAVLDAINGATTLAQLKTVLKTLVES